MCGSCPAESSRAADLSIPSDAPTRGQELAEHEDQRVPRQLSLAARTTAAWSSGCRSIVYTSEIGEHGRWRYVSPQIEEILGYTPEEWMADPGLWAGSCTPTIASGRSRWRAGSSATATPPPIDYRMITRDGEVVWILDEAVLEPDDGGGPGLARRPLRHHRAQDRRGGAAAGARPAGGRRSARRAGDAERRPRVADAGRGLADRRGRRRPQRLRLGGRPRRPPPQPARRPRGPRARRRQPRLRRARLARRRRARLRPTRSSPTGRPRTASRCRRCCGRSAPPAASRW